MNFAFTKASKQASSYRNLILAVFILTEKYIIFHSKNAPLSAKNLTKFSPPFPSFVSSDLVENKLNFYLTMKNCIPLFFVSITQRQATNIDS